MARKEIPAYKLMYLDQVYLLTACREGGKNIHAIPQLWAMPVSFKPQIIAVAVAKDRYMHRLLKDAREFVLNIPSDGMAAKVWSCALPCRDGDKLRRAKLKVKKASKVKPPLVTDCLAAIECKVLRTADAGDHTIFIAEVVATHKFRSGNVLVNAPGSHKFNL